MRKFITLLLIASCFSAAADQNKMIKSSAEWTSTNKTIWSLNRVPQSGDTIVIPEKSVLTLAQDITLSKVLLDVSGTLVLDGNNMKLTLDEASKIIVPLGGTILGSKNSQHILIDKLIYQGDKGVIVGPMMANITTKGFVFMPMQVTPLPVKFIGFSAARKNAAVLVQWATSQEVNADFYEVQRSEDGKNWRAIGTVKAVGTTNNTSTYSYTDYNVAQKTVYYRIKQVDIDNRFEYTPIRTVKPNSAIAEVNATASRGNIVLQFSKQVSGQVEVRLVSLNGQVISRQLLNKPAGQLVIPAAVKGNYILTVSDQQDIQINKQILL
jgi:hypothetical protein